GFADFETRRAAALREGRHIGIGLSNYVEGTGRGPFERGAVRIGSSGKIMVTTGAAAQGQGTHTMLAQVAAQALGVRPQDVHVTSGDTSASPLAHGASESRQAVVAGNAVHLAARAVAEKARQAAAAMLEVAPEDLELVDAMLRVKGADLKRSLGQIAHALSGVAGFSLPPGITPGLAAAVDFAPPAITYTNGSHVAEVEVDIDSGEVRLLRYV